MTNPEDSLSVAPCMYSAVMAVPHELINEALDGNELHGPGKGLDNPTPVPGKKAPTAQVPRGVVYNNPLKNGGMVTVVAGKGPKQEPAGAA